MDVVNTSRITRFIPPTISRWPEPDEPHPSGRPVEAEVVRPNITAPPERGTAPANPLAALFATGGKWPFSAPRQSDSDDDQPTLGRFVDVIA